MFSKVDDFMEKLSKQTAPMAKNATKKENRVLEKISLNYEGNFGRYQVFPVDSVITDYPFVTLFDTREICVPRKNVSADGQENAYNAWIKILPKSAYVMKDMTGRVVSSLSSEDEQLHDQACAIFNELYNELDARNNRDLCKDLIRKRNYTIFHAMCMNKWGFEARNPERQNFCGLFICTAKGFITAVEDSVKERILMSGGDNTWISEVYNRNLSGRGGFLLFSISRSKSTPGYTVTVTHETGRAEMLKNISINPEDAELMKDPVATFLGWQANREENVEPEQRRLFNAPLMKEAIEFMSNQLAAIRTAKQSGVDVSEAIKTTNKMALENSVVTNTMGREVEQKVVDNNTAPFQTPPVMHCDPVTSAPVDNGSSTFKAPSFGEPTAAPEGKGMMDFPF